MYQSTAVLGTTTSALVLAQTGASTGALAHTGLSILWLMLAAFTLISAGFALLRLVPRRASTA